MEAIYTSPEGRRFGFNAHVCVEMLMGVPDEKRTGRLVQVRKGVGAFKSDLYFIRLRDGSLMTFSNVMIRSVNDRAFVEAFYRGNDVPAPVIPEQPIDEADHDPGEYTLDEFTETGFIIEHPKQPCSSVQSFAMTITMKEPTS